MTRTVLVLTAICAAAIVAGAATSVLVRDFGPAAPQGVPAKAATNLIGPSPNTDGKRDKLPVERSPDEGLDEPLRDAFASDSPLTEERSTISGPVPMPRPRGAARPAVQKNYTLLSDIQIAAIKARLRLTPAQERHWPDVEAALREMARTMHERRQANPAVGASQETASEFEQLKEKAAPLLLVLREDQKRELRQLARLIGLEAVASQI